MVWSFSNYNQAELVQEFVDSTNVVDKENFANIVHAMIWYFGARPESTAAAYAWDNFRSAIKAHEDWYDDLMKKDEYEKVCAESAERHAQFLKNRKMAW